MTANQRKFADEFLVCGNATNAYKAAYPNVKKDETAASNGARLLRNAKVKSYVDQQLEKISSEKTADAKEVMEYLTSVMRGESKSTVCVTVGTGDGKSEAQLVEKPPEEKERLKAAELLGRRYGLYTDKVDVNSAASVIISGENDLEE
jgi:phage terminase small subunit